MTLSDHQHEFIKDLSTLIEFLCHAKGYKVTGGRLKDTIENQKILFEKGLSKTLDSNHLDALAIDLNIFFKNIVLTNEPKKDLTQEQENILSEIGVFWECLSKYNRWGGFFKNFYDPAHFERNIK